jgi:hypothetical protein
MAKAKKTAPNNVAPDRFLLVPGGFRREHLVSKVRKKKGVAIVDISKYQGKLPIADTLNPNWVAYAAWKKTPGNPVLLFSADFVVPPLPTDDFQTIFIFIGLQNNNHIVQPVLQYGVSGAGGGAYWSALSFFAGGQSDPAKYSSVITVTPGQPLTAVISGTPSGAGTLDYQCYFVGLDGTQLTIPGVPEMTYCCGTLESYHVAGAADYPASPFAALTNIQVNDAAGNIQVPWSLSPNPGKLGEHAVVDRQPGQRDEIELHYAT